MGLKGLIPRNLLGPKGLKFLHLKELLFGKKEDLEWVLKGKRQN